MKLLFGEYIGQEVSEIAKNKPSYLFEVLKHTEDQYKSSSFYTHATDELYKGEQAMPFGKHQNTPIKDIKDEDPQYLKWLHPKLEEGWLKSVIHHLIYQSLD